MQDLATTLLTTQELTGSAQRLLPVMESVLADQPLLEKVRTAALQNAKAIDLSMTRKRGSEYTEALQKADESRDAAFVALRNFAASWGRNPVASPEQQAAGKRLEAAISKHGNTLYDLGYLRQTGALQGLFADLDQDPSQADLTLLGLTPLYAGLQSAQEKFETLTSDKTDEEALENLPLIRVQAPQLRRRLNLLLANFAEWETLEPSEAVQATTAKLDEIIIEVMGPVRARRTRSANAEAEAAEEAAGEA